MISESSSRSSPLKWIRITGVYLLDTFPRIAFLYFFPCY